MVFMTKRELLTTYAYICLVTEDLPTFPGEEQRDAAQALQLQVESLQVKTIFEEIGGSVESMAVVDSGRIDIMGELEKLKKSDEVVERMKYFRLLFLNNAVNEALSQEILFEALLNALHRDEKWKKYYDNPGEWKGHLRTLFKEAAKTDDKSGGTKRERRKLIHSCQTMFRNGSCLSSMAEKKTSSSVHKKWDNNFTQWKQLQESQAPNKAKSKLTDLPKAAKKAGKGESPPVDKTDPSDSVLGFDWLLAPQLAACARDDIMPTMLHATRGDAKNSANVEQFLAAAEAVLENLRGADSSDAASYREIYRRALRKIIRCVKLLTESWVLGENDFNSAFNSAFNLAFWKKELAGIKEKESTQQKQQKQC